MKASMNHLLEMIKSSIAPQAQSQAGSNDQLAELVLIARHLGLNDAASLIEVSQKIGVALPELRG